MQLKFKDEGECHLRQLSEQIKLNQYKIHRCHLKHPWCSRLFGDYYKKKEMTLIHRSIGCRHDIRQMNNSELDIIEPLEFSQIYRNDRERTIWTLAILSIDRYYIKEIKRSTQCRSILSERKWKESIDNQCYSMN